jgi:hypothetical protein
LIDNYKSKINTHEKILIKSPTFFVIPIKKYDK